MYFGRVSVLIILYHVVCFVILVNLFISCNFICFFLFIRSCLRYSPFTLSIARWTLVTILYSADLHFSSYHIYTYINFYAHTHTHTHKHTHTIIHICMYSSVYTLIKSTCTSSLHCTTMSMCKSTSNTVSCSMLPKCHCGHGNKPLGHAKSASWTAVSLSQKLGGTDKGSMDPRDGEGLPDTLPLIANSTMQATPPRFYLSQTRLIQQEVKEL